jgi:hypothetical protein
MDEVLVEEGATLYSSDLPIRWDIRNGPGVDLDVQGRFEDHVGLAASWEQGSSWRLGPLATIVRTRSTSALSWKEHYWGGIATIPSTSTWYLLRTGNDQPAFTTAGMYYGNLVFGTTRSQPWVAHSAASVFSGWTLQAPRIKGNLHVGVAGQSGVTIRVETPALIEIAGNLTVEEGSALHLANHAQGGAKGLMVLGDAFLHGTVLVDTAGALASNRTLIFESSKLVLSRPQYWWNVECRGTCHLQGVLQVNHSAILRYASLVLEDGHLHLMNTREDALQYWGNSYLVDEQTDHQCRFFRSVAPLHTYEIRFGDYNDPSSFAPLKVQWQGDNTATLGFHSFATDPLNVNSVEDLQTVMPDVHDFWMDRFWKIQSESPTDLRFSIQETSEDKSWFLLPSLHALHAGIAHHASLPALWLGRSRYESLSVGEMMLAEDIMAEEKAEDKVYRCYDLLGRLRSEEEWQDGEMYLFYFSSGKVEKRMMRRY